MIEAVRNRFMILWFLTKDAYVRLVTQGVPGPLSFSYFAPLVLLPAALLVHPTYLSQRQAVAGFLVPIYAGVIHAWFAMGGVDVISVDALLWSTYLIAFKDPRRDFQRLRGAHKTPESYPEDFTRRAIWVVTLLASTRLHRWTIGEPSHDEQQRKTNEAPNRMSFVLSLLSTILLSILAYPLIVQLARYDPGVTSLRPDGAIEPGIVALIRSVIPQRMLTPLIGGLYSYCIVSGGFLFPAPVVVAANYLFNIPPTSWSPHALPAYFGSFSNVLDFGITGLWGRWWHQHMRIMVSWPGRAVADALKLNPKTPIEAFGRYALQVSSGFFFSGITHMGLVPPLAPGAMKLRLYIAGFFWIQAFAVLLEAAFANIWQAVGLSAWSCSRNALLKVTLRCLRLTWAVAWMCLSLNLLVLPLDSLGWWKGWWLWPSPGLGHLFTTYTSGEWIP